MFLHGYGAGRGRFAPLNRLLRTDRFVPPMIVVALLVGALGCAHRAHAADGPEGHGNAGNAGSDERAAGPLTVATVRLEASDAYVVERVYGGEVRARRTSTLGFRHAGELEAVHVDEGETVEAGALLAELDPEPLAAALDAARARAARAEASLAAARADEALAAATDRRFADLVDRGHASAQRADEARLDLAARRARSAVAEADLRSARAEVRAAEVDLERARIRAPYAGRVQARFADEGTILVPGQQVLRLVESGVAEARIGLPTDVAADLAAGGTHRLRAAGRVLEGRLLHVLPEVDDRTRTVTALFRIEAERAPPAGSVIELLLDRRVAEDGFWVPITALAEAQRGLWSVYVVADRGGERVAERRIVEVIHTTPERVYVRGTLADGETVVATGTQRLVPGQPVAVAADPAGAAARVARR